MPLPIPGPGRPRTLDRDTLTPAMRKVCELVAEGATGAAAAAAVGVSRTAINHWRAKVAAFGDEYERARKLGCESMVDELRDMRDPEKWPDVQRAKLVADGNKWLLARLDRDTYGDRLDVAVDVRVDLAGALADAKARVRPMCDPADAIDAEYTVDSDPCALGPPDKQSADPAQVIDSQSIPDIFT